MIKIFFGQRDRMMCCGKRKWYLISITKSIKTSIPALLIQSYIVLCADVCQEVYSMGLLPDTQNCGLRMYWEWRESFHRHQLQIKPLVSEPGMHHGTGVTHVPWCMLGLLTRGGGTNVPGIPGACAIHNLSAYYICRGCTDSTHQAENMTMFSLVISINFDKIPENKIGFRDFQVYRLSSWRGCRELMDDIFVLKVSLLSQIKTPIHQITNRYIYKFTKMCSTNNTKLVNSLIAFYQPIVNPQLHELTFRT